LASRDTWPARRSGLATCAVSESRPRPSRRTRDQGAALPAVASARGRHPRQEKMATTQGAFVLKRRCGRQGSRVESCRRFEGVVAELGATAQARLGHRLESGIAQALGDVPRDSDGGLAVAGCGPTKKCAMPASQPLRFIREYAAKRGREVKRNFRSWLLCSRCGVRGIEIPAALSTEINSGPRRTPIV
jgi:hypothetical protein